MYDVLMQDFVLSHQPVTLRFPVNKCLDSSIIFCLNPMQMREDTRTGVYVENLSEVEVQNVQDVIDLLIQVL